MMCIYKIVNVLNKKEYIGSAKIFRKRKNVHLADLRNNKHHSSKLQNSWNKYGENNFEFMIIEEVNTPKELLIREQFWIDTLKPYFNICKVAGSPIGVKHTRKARNNMRNAHLGKKLTKESIEKRTLKQSGDNHWTKKPKNKKAYNNLLKASIEASKDRIGTKQSEETIRNRVKNLIKPIFQFSIDNVFIREWKKGAKDIGKKLDLKYNNIWYCCRGKLRECGGFKWSYTKEVVDILFPIQKKAVIQFDKLGNKIREFSCIAEASKLTGILANRISISCTFNRTAGGFFWVFKGQELILRNIKSGLKIPIIRINPITNEGIEFNSIMEAGRINKINVPNISECCKGKRKIAGGFKWKYKKI